MNVTNTRPEAMTQREALVWIADLFEEPSEQVRADTALDAIPTWDSLGVLTLLAGLNERFDITVEVEELDAMSTVDDILAVLRRAGKLNLTPTLE
jgi:acyl carrier protein